MAWLLVEIREDGSGHEGLPEKPFALSSFTLDLLMDTYTTSYLEGQALSNIRNLDSLAFHLHRAVCLSLALSFQLCLIRT